MKPNDFILNSDYIALSTAVTATYTVAFAGGTIEYEPFTTPFATQTVDLAVPRIEEAEFQYMISTDGTNWYPTSMLAFDFNSTITGRVVVARTSATNLQVYLLAANLNGPTASYPSKQFWVKETAVIAPDME
jgi:hypothetical protein